MSNKAKKTILLILIILTIAFIFGNSLENRQSSAQISTAVYSVVSRMLPFISHKLLRKMAHFFEFMVLGSELVLYLHLCNKKIEYAVIIGMMAGAIDETIQYFVGRYASILDVLLDTSGVVIALLLFKYLIFPYLIKKESNS